MRRKLLPSPQIGLQGILDLQVQQDVHRAESDQRSSMAQRADADTQQEGQ